jgi:hypothetical protein
VRSVRGVARRLGVIFERLAVTLTLWIPLLLLWWLMMMWYPAQLDEAHRRGINVEPGELIITLPFCLLIVSWYVSEPVVRRLKRYWDTRRW